MNGYAGEVNARTRMPFLSPMGRYAIASQKKRKQIDSLNAIYYDKMEDKRFQEERDAMLEAGYLEPDEE